MPLPVRMKKNDHTVFFGTVLFFVLSAVMLVGSVIITQVSVKLPSRAENSYVISATQTSATSSYTEKQGATYFNIASVSDGSSLYTLPDNSAAAVIQFLAKNPSYTLLGTGEDKPLIPDNTRNIQLKERLSDKDVNALHISGIDGGAMHYYFQQTRCGGVPVYGAYLNVHVDASNEIYAIFGALAKDDAICARNVSKDAAEKTALQAFGKIVPKETLKIVASSDYVLDPVLNNQEGRTSSLTRRVEVCGKKDCRAYFIELDKGNIVYDVETSADALKRYIRTETGSAQRREGDPASTNASINKAYDYMGQIYNHYLNQYQRDSFNNSGGTMQVSIKSCGNVIDASWNGSFIQICESTLALDVLAHEFTHGVTQYTAGLEYFYESGGLNESLSDVMGAAIDSDDWLMGEDTIRAIRDLKDPPRFRQPDSMYHSNYYCGSADNGGVHINSGVFNKAYYLMSDGGSFRGCSMNGMGRDKAAKVVYKALSTYMRNNTKGNYKDMYNAVVQGCNDVFQSDSAECQNIKAAMEAVGMDKQTSGQSRGPSCSGGAEKPATCAGGTQPPVPTGDTENTPTPESTPVPTVTPAPSVTTTPMPTPTPKVETKIEAPLVSSLPFEFYFTGSVKITSNGSQQTLVAMLSSKSVETLMQQKLQGFSIKDDDDFVRGRLIGSSVLETGAFKVERDQILNEFTTTKDLSQYSAYQVYFTGSGDFPELPFLLADLNSTATPQSDKVVLNLTLRFQGIERKPPFTEAQLVKVGVGGENVPETLYTRAVFEPNAQGLWTGKAVFDIPSGDAYKVLVKGPKHIQKKYCDNNPSENSSGLYLCRENAVALKTGENVLDFSKVTQLAGDINQDGIVNSQDVLAVRDAIGSRVSLSYDTDVNSDGVVNSVDDSLVIFTLANRTEER